jgi:hypothetical protein
MLYLTFLWLAAFYVCLRYRYGECRIFGVPIRSFPLTCGGFHINGWSFERTVEAPGVYSYHGTYSR